MKTALLITKTLIIPHITGSVSIMRQEYSFKCLFCQCFLIYELFNFTIKSEIKPINYSSLTKNSVLCPLFYKILPVHILIHSTTCKSKSSSYRLIQNEDK